MRTREEILARVAAGQDTDFLGFSTSVLIGSLDFEDAKPFLNDNVTREAFVDAGPRLTDEEIKKQIDGYMTFAWGKVEGHRGISAGRSVDKMTQWVWLLGDDALLSRIEAAPYEQYGAPKLAVICEAYGLPIPDDEGIRRMIRGEMCSSDCQGGCAT